MTHKPLLSDVYVYPDRNTTAKMTTNPLEFDYLPSVQAGRWILYIFLRTKYFCDAKFDVSLNLVENVFDRPRCYCNFCF
jgi:hypothetical protein